MKPARSNGILKDAFSVAIGEQKRNFTCKYSLFAERLNKLLWYKYWKKGIANEVADSVNLLDN